MVLIFTGTWKYAVRGALAVVFSATVVVGSIYVILQEKEARKKTSAERDTPAVSEQTGNISDQTPVTLEQTPGTAEQTRESFEQTPATREQVSGEEQDEHGAAARAVSLDQLVSESMAQIAPRGLQIIRALPRSQKALAEAFQNAEPCAVVPPDQPLEQTAWAPEQYDDPTESSTAPSPPFGLRRSVLAIGLSLSAEEQERMSETKRERILENLDSHYISIQVNIQREAEGGAHYLHHFPFVAAARFEGPPVTGRAGAAIVASAGEFRRLGIWVADGAPATHENLRTLVLMHRQMVRDPGSDDAAGLRPNYELVFIHAKPTALAAGLDATVQTTAPTALIAGHDADARDTSETLTLHAFITSGGRSRLHHLPAATPSNPAACGIRANVQLIDFDPATADPDRSIVSDVAITDRADYPVEELDRYVSTQGWSGDAWDHVPEILDAAVDAKLELAHAPSPGETILTGARSHED